MNKEKAGRKKTLKECILTFITALGILIAVYPAISQLYYSWTARQVNTEFEYEKVKVDNAEADKKIAMAMAYNETLDPTKLSDPFNEAHKKGKEEYARILEVHERIGHVRIPRLNQDVPLYAGTAEVGLEKGAGHLEGTSLPVGGPNTHTVITAHRGLPGIRLFTDLDKMKEGDKFYIYNVRDVLCYQVDKIQVIEPNNFEAILVEEGKDYATLLTCTPYMVNSHRLLVRGVRIPYVAAVEEQEIKTIEEGNKYRLLFYVTAGVLGIVLVRILWKKYKKSKWVKTKA